MEPLRLALLWLPLSALHSRGLPLLSFVTMTSSSPLCSLLARPGQQEHHCCWFCSGTRMFILFSGSPRLLRQSGCQSAPRALEFGLKPSLSGARALPLPAQAGSEKGKTDLGWGKRVSDLSFNFQLSSKPWVQSYILLRRRKCAVFPSKQKHGFLWAPLSRVSPVSRLFSNCPAMTEPPLPP